MCAICRARARKIDELAASFRAKAAQTTMLHYIVLMSNVARSLEALSSNIREQCACADTDRRRREPEGCAGPHLNSNFNW